MSRLKLMLSNRLIFIQAMRVFRLLLPVAFVLTLADESFASAGHATAKISCQSLFTADFNHQQHLAKAGGFKSGVKPTELEFDAVQKIAKIPEFEFIREQAEKRGLRVWLFGGTASSYLHYVKWNLQREKGIINLQADRFDFDYTNIFRSTQDLDIVIDSDAAKAHEFEQLIANKFPHFLGAKAKWEVRTLRTRMGSPGDMGFKEALLGDLDFSQQNTDSNSLGMVEVTRSEKITGKHEPAIRDLKTWDQPNSQFLRDTLNNEISFFRSDKHFSTSRAKMGENPEILSVIRLLVKAFQYDLGFSQHDFAEMKKVVSAFDASQVQNSNAARRIADTAKKLVMHATNIEYAMNRLDELGLRKKLISIGDKNEINSSSWWLNKEPLRSKVVGQGSGKTAKELGIEVVAHETNSFLAYESITRSHSGEPNVLISRQGMTGEAAVYGDGFYTQMGRLGARGTGLTIRFTVDPNAKEGTDFKISGSFVIFLNKKSLRVIQESLNLNVKDLVNLLQADQDLQIERSDLALLEKLKRKLSASKINEEVEHLIHSPDPEDRKKLLALWKGFADPRMKKILNEDIVRAVLKRIYSTFEHLQNSKDEADIKKYLDLLIPVVKNLEEMKILKTFEFPDYLDQILKSNHSWNLREFAAQEELFLEMDPMKSNPAKYLSDHDMQVVAAKIKTWEKSDDSRQKKLYEKINDDWIHAIEKGEVAQIETFVKLKFFDLNYQNLSGFRILSLAHYYEQKDLVEWLIQNPKYDFASKNADGFTDVEQLRLIGENNLADRIQKTRPDAIGRNFKVKERNAEKSELYPEGIPIVDFVKIKGGSFTMGDVLKVVKVRVTLTKTFELMSTLTTQKLWKDVIDLASDHLPHKSSLNSTPSVFKGDMRPVENISHEDITEWMEVLNKLSVSDQPTLQKVLSHFFPGHQKGDIYGLPTEAQWEFVARLRGLSNGIYSHSNGIHSHSNTDRKIEDYAWISENSGTGTHPVGLKKPVFIEGKPIYDIHGNVWQFVADRHSNLMGGVDPQGPPLLRNQSYVIRGGSWDLAPYYARSGDRSVYRNPGLRYNDAGFRLVRIRP